MIIDESVKNKENAVAVHYDGFSPSLTRPSHIATQQFQNVPVSTQNYGADMNKMNQTPTTGNGGALPVR
ncbi:hypothetical protein ACHQM5_019517 [Ranunculus cassubicifolius]